MGRDAYSTEKALTLSARIFFSGKCKSQEYRNTNVFSPFFAAFNGRDELRCPITADNYLEEKHLYDQEFIV